MTRQQLEKIIGKRPDYIAGGNAVKYYMADRNWYQKAFGFESARAERWKEEATNMFACEFAGSDDEIKEYESSIEEEINKLEETL